MRSVVTRFEQGSSRTDDTSKSYVKVIVQYQFRAGAGDTTMTLDCVQNPATCFQAYHATLIGDEAGKLNKAAGSEIPGLELQNTAWGSVETSYIRSKIPFVFCK